MQQIKTEQLRNFVALLNTYPSPHNGQPMVLRKVAENKWDVFFDTTRGLRSTEISHLFSFVTVGVFFAHTEAVAKALGYVLDVEADLPPDESGMAGDGLLRCGHFRLRPGEDEKGDEEAMRAIRFRQTSRKKYTAGLSQAEKDRATKIASEHEARISFLDEHQAQQAIWLNQRAVFDDMFNPAVRTELMHWLRFDKKSKVSSRDGLAYDCMELNGRVLKYIVRHYRFLRWPMIAPMLQRYYLRTMRDNSSVGYMTAVFRTPQDAFRIGQCIERLWLMLSSEHAYIHPFGTIVSNEEAHADFVRLVGAGAQDRDASYVVFIFRAGRSDVPVRSERIAPEVHLCKEEKDV